MEGDVFERNGTDKMTMLISERLGERQKKLKQMEEWERKNNHKSRMHRIYILVSIAAGLLVLLVLSPFTSSESSPLDELGITAPTMSEFRAATPELTRINKLIEEENYEDALTLTAKAMSASDMAIYELEGVPEVWGSDEEAAYEDDIERVKNSELRWVYIYLLVKNEDKKTAKKELKKYLKYPQYCEHENEARELLKKLKK